MSLLVFCKDGSVDDCEILEKCKRDEEEREIEHQPTIIKDFQRDSIAGLNFALSTSVIAEGKALP